MPQYYLDIETTGLDPEKDKIISIQLQPLGRFTGKK
jgi:DNA polymerase III epsilon subunit-like protein